MATANNRMGQMRGVASEGVDLGADGRILFSVTSMRIIYKS